MLGIMPKYLTVAILTPLPVLPHFIWPLSWCIQADTCNHTWIPECGEEITTFTDYRLFIDDCDLYEYNCDNDREFEIANYSDCFGPATGCPKHGKKNFYRMGNYKFELEGRKMIYAPTEKSWPAKHTTLPMRMLKGRRRYTPEVKRRMMRERLKMHTRKMPKKYVTAPSALRPPTREATTAKLESYVIRTVPVIKNGKKMIKVFKGFRKAKKPAKNQDSDFIE